MRETAAGILVLMILTVLFSMAARDIFDEVFALSPWALLGVSIIGIAAYLRYRSYMDNVPTITVLIIGAVILVVGAAGWGAAVSWKTVDTDADGFSATEWAYQRNAVKLTNGTLAFFYVDSSDADVNLSTSTDNGATWTHRGPVDDGDKDVDQVCAEVVRQVPVEPVQDIIVVTWREEKTADPQLFQIKYALVSTLTWDALFTGYVSTTALNQVDPYVAWDGDTGVVVVYAEENIDGNEDYTIFETVATVDDLEEPQWDEGEPAYTGEDVNWYAERWPSLAFDRNQTLHMTFSAENSSGLEALDDELKGDNGVWQLWYCNRTSVEPLFDDFMLVYDNSLGNDQKKGSLVCANVTSGGESRDGLIVAWESDSSGGLPLMMNEGPMWEGGDCGIAASGMWEGDTSFQAEITELDDDGAGPCVGFHANRIIVVWSNTSTHDIRWGYTDFAGWGLELDVTIAEVPGQDSLTTTFRYDPSLVWSYYGGHHKYIVTGTQACWLLALSDTDQVWSCNLYTAPPSNPPGGGGGGGGGGGAATTSEESSGDELCGTECCGSTSAVIAVAVSWFGMVGYMKTRKRRSVR